jgi:hypothetical protein
MQNSAATDAPILPVVGFSRREASNVRALTGNAALPLFEQLQ